ncbi:hypothetical protein [Pseudomonas sp. FSL R10-1339]|uniref:hypothetical protein n=1 Tax=Pseudomonas sp. FSL R10-1339 TaxID=2662196 RepID=UPI00129793B3|nr:hypothetical protein [Pseudomonas sp. FSL R10-1339]MQU51781.1 hypothetical protein [Pseudomonas sp. FSL R10-1339]
MNEKEIITQHIRLRIAQEKNKLSKLMAENRNPNAVFPPEFDLEKRITLRMEMLELELEAAEYMYRKK